MGVWCTRIGRLEGDKMGRPDHDKMGRQHGQIAGLNCRGVDGGVSFLPLVEIFLLPLPKIRITLYNKVWLSHKNPQDERH